MGWQDAPEVGVTQKKAAWMDAPEVDAKPVQSSAPAEGQITRFDKVGKGMRDPIDGGAQLLTKMLPDSVVKAGNSLNNWLADKTGLVGRLPDGGVDQQVRDDEKAYQAKRTAAGESGFDGYRLTGNVLSPANLAIAARAPQAVSLAGRVAVGTGFGAGSAALSPVTEGDFVPEKLKQIGIGAVGGAAIPVAGNALSRIISPNNTRNAGLNLLRAEGVKPTVGQALGGKWNTLEEKMTSVPIVGDAIASARNRANSSFEAATHNRALSQIGEKLPSGVSGRDAVVYTEGKLRESYDDVLGKIGAIAPDSQFNQKMTSLKSMVDNLVMPKAEKAKFAAALNDVKQSIDNNGVITSDAFKALESSLGSDARKLASSTNIYEGKLSPAVAQLRAELQDMLQRQAGGNSDQLKATNAAWANFKRVQNASAKIGAEDGSFTPAQFQNAVRAMDKSKDKAAFARGGALGQDLGDAGKVTLGNKVPNSGTAERLMYGGGALASYLVNPLIPASLLGGAGLYTKPGQAALNALIGSRPQGSQAVANALNKNSSALLPLGAQIGLSFNK